MNSITLITPSLFGKTALKTFQSIYNAISGSAIDVIVVSDNKTADLSLVNQFGFRAVYNPKKGVASARNYGASLTQSGHLLFIDDDMLISAESIQCVIEFIQKFPNDCLNIEWDYPPNLYKTMQSTSFGRFLITNGFTNQRGWAKEWDWHDNAQYEIPLVASYFLLVSKQKFDAINGYNENFPYAGFEDYDFPVRLKQLGVKMYIDTSVLIYHNEEEKTELKGWLRRKVTGGYTQIVGVELGYADKIIHYGILKKLAYGLANNFYSSFIWLGERLSDKKTMDKLTFRYFNFLLGLSIYKGYHKKV